MCDENSIGEEGDFFEIRLSSILGVYFNGFEEFAFILESIFFSLESVALLISDFFPFL
jgi:hypothetical protein